MNFSLNGKQNKVKSCSFVICFIKLWHFFPVRNKMISATFAPVSYKIVLCMPFFFFRFCYLSSTAHIKRNTKPISMYWELYFSSSRFFLFIETKRNVSHHICAGIGPIGNWTSGLLRRTDVFFISSEKYITCAPIVNVKWLLWLRNASSILDVKYSFNLRLCRFACKLTPILCRIGFHKLCSCRSSHHQNKVHHIDCTVPVELNDATD